MIRGFNLRPKPKPCYGLRRIEGWFLEFAPPLKPWAEVFPEKSKSFVPNSLCGSLSTNWAFIFPPPWFWSDICATSSSQLRQLGWRMRFVNMGGSGDEEAVEVVGAARWLDERIGKLVLISVHNLVCLIVKTFETVHGKPFYKRAGVLLLAARCRNLAAEFCVSCCWVKT